MSKKEPSFLFAYLVVGDDELKTATVTKRLWQRLEELGNIEFNSQTFEGSRDFNTYEVLDALNTPPLGAPYRLVLINDLDKTGKELIELLTEYLKSPLETTILAMTATKLSKQSRLYKAVSALNSKAVIDASSPKRNEMLGMVRQLAETYHITLSYDGAVALVELTGSSTRALNTELKKLAAYVLAQGHREASVEDVREVVAHTSQPTVWSFVDAFARRDLTTSLSTLHMLKHETPAGLLALLVMRIREMLLFTSLVARKDTTALLASGKQDWQLRQLEVFSRLYTPAELRALLAQAAQCDVRMKSGSDALLVLEEFILANGK